MVIYSQYSEYMAKAMSAARPGPDPDEWAHMLKYLQSNEEPFLELACGTGRMLLAIMEAGYHTDDPPASDASEVSIRCRKPR